MLVAGNVVLGSKQFTCGLTGLSPDWPRKIAPPDVTEPADDLGS